MRWLQGRAARLLPNAGYHALGELLFPGLIVLLTAMYAIAGVVVTYLAGLALERVPVRIG